MRSIIIAAYLIIGGGTFLVAQENYQYVWYPVETYEETISFEVDRLGNRLVLQEKGRTGEAKLIRIEGPKLIDADLRIVGQPALANRRLNYHIKVKWIRSRNGQLLGEQELSGEAGKTDAIITLSFEDATEVGLFLGETYKLHIQKQLLSTIDCEGSRPTFTAQKQLPSLGLATAGLIAVGIGEGIYGQQQRQDYAAYQARWKNSELDDAGLLNTAQSALNSRRWFNIGGGLAMLVGGTWWLLDQQKIQRNQRLYDTYCSPGSTSLQLRLILMGNALALTPGVQLTYQIR